MADTITAALFVRLEARPCFAVRFAPSTFGIFDAFPNDAGRGAHLTGGVGKALAEKTPELFSQPATIEKRDVLAASHEAEDVAQVPASRQRRDPRRKRAR
jgi:hypothetical protein